MAPPVRVRGTFFLSSVRFVRAMYGPEAHERVVEHLPDLYRATFAAHLGRVRDSSWEPLDPVLAYMEAAQRLLAPDDPTFYRAMGRFAGEAARSSEFSVMLSSPDTAIRMLRVVARAFMNVGRIEITARWPQGFRSRLHDYPPVRSLCERRIGAWQVMLSGEGRAARVEETACAARGSPYCEIDVTFAGPADPA